MKITLEITKDNFDEDVKELVISDTEVEEYKWLEVDGTKYSIQTDDLIKTLIALTARREN